MMLEWGLVLGLLAAPPPAFRPYQQGIIAIEPTKVRCIGFSRNSRLLAWEVTERVSDTTRKRSMQRRKIGLYRVDGSLIAQFAISPRKVPSWAPQWDGSFATAKDWNKIKRVGKFHADVIPPSSRLTWIEVTAASQQVTERLPDSENSRIITPAGVTMDFTAMASLMNDDDVSLGRLRNRAMPVEQEAILRFFPSRDGKSLALVAEFYEGKKTPQHYLTAAVALPWPIWTKGMQGLRTADLAMEHAREIFKGLHPALDDLYDELMP